MDLEEGSLLLAVGNRFLHNVIGVQAKDSSVADIWNSDFVGNGTAVDAYKKNWRYDGGGHVALGKVRMLATSGPSPPTRPRR